MNLLQTPIFFFYISLVGASLLPFHPPDNIAINCGFSGKKTAPNGRKWIGDSGSTYFVSGEPNSKSISSAPVEQSSPSHATIPYTHARISQTQFTYVFPISPGPKFVRLHFNPSSYRAFHRSNAFFTVKANRYTLLHNFSVSLTADALGITTVSKEFCLNVEANQPLIITFSPSRTTPSDKVYAFVNGIEVVSMPNGLYYSMKENIEWDQKLDFTSLWGSTALETVHRLNIGGSFISSSEDTGMSREWFEDTKFFLHSGVLPLTTTMQIKYGKMHNFVAPQNVYQTSWFVDPNKNAEEFINFTWKVPVDQGFRYIIRFHFCELDYEIKERGQRLFSIYVDNHMVEPHGDIIKWTGEIGVATYKDYIYVVEGDRMDGKRNILVSLCPIGSNHDVESNLEAPDAILKGLEIFKLSNPDNNLASTNPLVSSSLVPTDKPSKVRKSLYISAGGNIIATIIILILTTLSVVSYKLRREDCHKQMIFPRQYEGPRRSFSLAEVQFATKNFDSDLVIGKGGFGKVYKASIDSGTNIVAMKRLHSSSKQGATEFWTEIEMLSELRNNNLVTLIGYCNEGSEMILVYEYMECGTLADHLYKNSQQGIASASPLSWEQRLKICIDAARGLEYLHNCNEWGIIHRDVKSTNILLDQNLVAKIADFGLSKMVPTSHSLTHISTSVKGTFGYLDPEYFLTRRLTKKSDVYAFGVVLWEVLCGRPAIDTNAEGPERSLALWSQYCFNEGMVDEIIEPILKGQIPATCLKIFTQLANLCLKNDPTERPSMAGVVEELERALVSMKQVVNKGTDSTIVLADSDGAVPRSQMVNDGAMQMVYQDTNSTMTNDETELTSSPSQDSFSSPSSTLKLPKKKSRIGKMFQTFALWGSRFSAKPAGEKTKSEIDELVSSVTSDSMSMHNNPSSRHYTTRNSLIFVRMPNPKDIFDLEDLLRASSEVLGKGTFGTSYKAVLEMGLVVTVKRLKDVVLSKEDFGQNLEAIGLMDHENLVKLKAYYYSKGEQLLVYDYFSTGSLFMHLHGKHGSGKVTLNWKTRIGIARGVAQGIAYIHEQGPTTCHGNIRSLNILLTKSLEPLISDVCTWTLVVELNTYASGYTAPEKLKYSQKADVYSYGILLLELLTGKPPFQSLVKDNEGVDLPRWVQASGLKMEKKRIIDVIDIELLNSNIYDYGSQLILLALDCADPNPDNRPLMATVASKIAKLYLLSQE
ncbi:receptor-like protein kinase FERONIA [Impatiens glandulifera]|uniref:receptor-like protein kinase FERONIA n=1 Tax=Impatiens glandulifera TaxID=253017 RepID=UPI001FB07A6B|nr:receptor-like protein kinase FERONIA [Impatiens glandulifera]